METSRVAPLVFARRLDIETPEGVVIALELAGVGSRFAAAVYDQIVLVLLMLACILVMVFVFDVRGLGPWLAAVFVLLGLVLTWGYFALCEWLMRGQTPGKRQVGLRVVMDTGHPLTFGAAMTRNLLRLVDSQPGWLYVIGSLFVGFHAQHKRLGDMVAGTIVIRDRPSERPFAAPTRRPAAALAESGTPELADAEFTLLEQFLARRDGLEAAVRVRIAHDLARRFSGQLVGAAGDAEARLAMLLERERGRRAGRLGAARGARGGAASAAGRFVARQQPVWEAFRAEAVGAERRGLLAMEGEALTRFAARYREVAADLARARTYGVDARVLEQLDRVVSAGHNALYGLSGVRRRPLARLVLRDVPAAVWEARWYVLVAFLLLAAPALAGFAMIRERPARVWELLPDEMIARAESGRQQSAQGEGYAQMPSPYLPVVASSLIANNVQVAIAAFAGGITAGLVTMWVLVFNGLSFGAIVGLFANYGLAGWLLTFVAGHGVLELTAIFIAGGSGLVIARALVAPGDRSRRDALVVEGRRAFLMMAAAAMLLLLAGTIEGLLSASDAPAALKFGVSGASAVLLVLLALVGKKASALQPLQPAGRLL